MEAQRLNYLILTSPQFNQTLKNNRVADQLFASGNNPRQCLNNSNLPRSSNLATSNNLQLFQCRDWWRMVVIRSSLITVDVGALTVSFTKTQNIQYDGGKSFLSTRRLLMKINVNIQATRTVVPCRCRGSDGYGTRTLFIRLYLHSGLVTTLRRIS